MPELKFMKTAKEDSPNPKVLVEYCYGIIKELAMGGNLHSEDLDALADLTTELSNRLKVEENSGE